MCNKDVTADALLPGPVRFLTLGVFLDGPTPDRIAPRHDQEDGREGAPLGDNSELCEHKAHPEGDTNDDVDQQVRFVVHQRSWLPSQT